MKRLRRDIGAERWTEMGTIRIGIAHPLNDRNLSLIIKFLDRGHIWIEAQVIINWQDPVQVFPNNWPAVRV